jgi:hypothetical protein
MSDPAFSLITNILLFANIFLASFSLILKIFSEIVLRAIFCVNTFFSSSKNDSKAFYSYFILACNIISIILVQSFSVLNFWNGSTLTKLIRSSSINRLTAVPMLGSFLVLKYLCMPHLINISKNWALSRPTRFC